MEGWSRIDLDVVGDRSFDRLHDGESIRRRRHGMMRMRSLVGGVLQSLVMLHWGRKAGWTASELSRNGRRHGPKGFLISNLRFGGGETLGHSGRCVSLVCVWNSERGSSFAFTGTTRCLSARFGSWGGKKRLLPLNDDDFIYSVINNGRAQTRPSC